MKLVTSEQMRRLEELSVKAGVSTEALMENAGLAVAQEVWMALGTGARGLAWREIEVLPNRRGKPLLYLHGRAGERAETIGLHAVDVSLTHSDVYALAIVVGLQEKGLDDPQAARERLIDWLRERGRL